MRWRVIKSFEPSEFQCNHESNDPLPRHPDRLTCRQEMDVFENGFGFGYETAVGQLSHVASFVRKLGETFIGIGQLTNPIQEER